MPGVAVLILTHNEGLHLARAIESVSTFADSLHIVDSGSKDDTVAIAQRRGAEVLTHPWKNYADQFQWGLNNADITADWIMRLDADEVVEPDLADRIRTELPSLPTDVVGVNLDRKHVFMGRWIRHGGRYPLTLLRIFRRGHGRIEQRWMDEHILVVGGRTVHFKGGFADINLNDLSYFTDKHNKYATREAIDVLNQRLGLFARDVDLDRMVSHQAALKRWIKEHAYNRIPFEISSFAYFLYRYFVLFGFLDGREGLIYHFLQGYWYRFLVGAKVHELERVIEDIGDKDEICRRLTEITGLNLSEQK